MGSGERPRVLLIEDDAHMALVLRDVLDDAGYLVFVATDGAYALRILPAVQPDVIISDMMLPVLDGLAFLERHVAASGPRAPVVAVSALQPYLAHARALGAASTLLKPLDVDELLRVLRRLCDGEPVPPGPGAAPDDGETRRLQALLELDLGAAAPVPGLERFLGLVAAMLEVPTCMVSIVTEREQRCVQACGLPATLAEGPVTPRELSFCTHAVAARSALVVEDTHANPLFRENPIVRAHGLRFYAGVPLDTRHGEVLGTLCVLDVAPRLFGAHDLELLGVCARRVLADFEECERRAAPLEPLASFRYLHCVDRELDVLGRELFVELLAAQAYRHAERRRPLAVAAVSAPEQRLAAVARALEAEVRASCVGRLGRTCLGWIVPATTAEQARARAARIVGPEGRVRAAETGRFPGAFGRMLREVETAVD